MFYSHEILANTQYGVATIWMIATTGKSSQRKITKKAINEVNVPKACKTFTDPEAPLALRLQGNLLYGVSRVFQQQTGYVLTEAERIQSDMLSYFRTMNTSHLDPQGGKTKRQNITVQDDPNFDPFSALPGLDLFAALDWNGSIDNIFASQKTDSQMFSQLTPLPSQNSSQNRSKVSINLPEESFGSYHFPSDLGHNSPASWKPNYQSEFDQPLYHGDKNLGGFSIDFDAEGNLIELDQPILAVPPKNNRQDAQEQVIIAEEPVNVAAQQPGVFIMGEQPLPDAEAFPSRKAPGQHNTPSTLSSEESATGLAAAAKVKKSNRKKKAAAMADEYQQLSRQEMRGWQQSYGERMEEIRQQPKATPIAQARKNALAFLYGGGVASIGAFAIADVDNFTHPLAAEFAGNVFRAAILGREVEEDQRNVRPRLDDEGEIVRHNDDQQLPILGDESNIELGMEAQAGMGEHHSSMPWSRAPSVMPGSSIKGSAQKPGYPAPSPLIRKGSVVGSIERHSDLPFGSNGLGDGGHSPSGDIEPMEGIEHHDSNVDTQTSENADLAGQRFLGYAITQADETAVEQDDQGRRWVDFESLAAPEEHSKLVAAQAFLHVLTLATKNAISVRQEVVGLEPFGKIEVGVSQPIEVDE